MTWWITRGAVSRRTVNARWVGPTSTNRIRESSRVGNGSTTVRWDLSNCRLQNLHRVLQTCESEIHRACAGAPWSLFDPNEDAEGEEPVWVCQGCSSVNCASDDPPPTAPSTSQRMHAQLDAADS